MDTVAEIEDTHPGRIVVRTDFRFKDSVKAVPGARWDSKVRVWHVPLSWPSALALRNEFGDRLELGPRLTSWGMGVKPSKDWLAGIRNDISDEAGLPSPAHLPGFDTLYPYQRTGAWAIYEAERYILLDETGTGKSRTALAGLSLLEDHDRQIFPALIVAPKSMLRTWRTEIARFFPKADAVVVEGTPKQVELALSEVASFYIMSYDTVRLRSRHAPFPTVKLSDKEKTDGPLQSIDFKTVVADEVHRIKNPASKRTRALWYIGQDADFKIGLTGTPVQESPEDIWSLLRFIAPDEYPVKSGYVDRYCNVTFNIWGGREITGISPWRSDEFFANFDTRTRRVTKEAALPFLPEKVYETRWVQLPSKHRKMYDEMETRMVAATIDGEDVVAVGSVLEKANRLIQIANAAGHVDEDGVFHMDSDNSPKVDAFVADALDGDFDGSQVVVFSDSRELLRVCAEKMTTKKIPFTEINGDVTGQDRQDAMDAFQNGEVPFLLLTRAGGEGITLTAADTMVRLVRSWSYTVHTQAEDRVHRIGSEIHESVRYIDYLTEDTVEEGQMARLMSKEARAQEVLRDGELLDLIRNRKGELV